MSRSQLDVIQKHIDAVARHPLMGSGSPILDAIKAQLVDLENRTERLESAVAHMKQGAPIL